MKVDYKNAFNSVVGVVGVVVVMVVVDVNAVIHEVRTTRDFPDSEFDPFVTWAYGTPSSSCYGWRTSRSR